MSTDYKPCFSCGAECDDKGTEGEPCWGMVVADDEWWDSEGDSGDYFWIHHCQGHLGYKYRNLDNEIQREVPAAKENQPGTEPLIQAGPQD